MARDEEDDLYDEEFDFVDEDDDDDAESDDEDDNDDDSPSGDTDIAEEEDSPLEGEANGEVSGEPAEEPVDEYGRTAPLANYVVHVYENKKLKRTIDRAFTPEEAEAFATEYNRTGKNYARVAVTAKNDVTPKKSID